MKIEQTTETFRNKVWVTHKYIREHWYEWLYIRVVEEGEMCPRFYLPIYRDNHSRSYFAWITPLAPFALLATALHSAFWSFWRDCIWAISKWRSVKRPDEVRQQFLDN